MITRIELLQTIANYEAECNKRKRKMSRAGIARRLGISPQTINNVCSGYYNVGKPYTPTPSASRCIDNSDFDLIQGLFSLVGNTVSLHEKSPMYGGIYANKQEGQINI